MTVLSNRQIFDRLGDSVIIHPFNRDNVNTSSYDVSLGRYYYAERIPSVVRRVFNPVYNIWDYDDVRRVWDGPFEAMTLYWWRRKHPWRFRGRYKGILDTDRVIFIPPKHTILSHTCEFIGGRASLVPLSSQTDPSTSMMKARSSYGRNFIEVCKCAGYGDVGYTNRWTMEITNNSRFYYIPLVVGRRVAQIVFMETGPLVDSTEYSDTGKYQWGSDVRELELRWRPEMMLPRLDQDRDNPDRTVSLSPR